jgi:YfiH family protein
MMQLPADWIAPDWPAPPNVRCLITTRNGGFSVGACASMNLSTRVGDDPQAVARNRALLRGLLPGEPFWLQQVHGTLVVAATDAREPMEADASLSTTAGTVCVVTVADCLPVLFCDRAGTVVAAAHAGWRGLSASVLERTVAAMPCPAADVLAFLGPAIGPEAFEVGADVLDAFIRTDAEAAGAFRSKAPTAGQPKWWADLYALARQRLARTGVTDVFGGGWCTYRDSARFFSHRRDPHSGRQAALIWLTAREAG